MFIAIVILSIDKLNSIRLYLSCLPLTFVVILFCDIVQHILSDPFFKDSITHCGKFRCYSMFAFNEKNRQKIVAIIMYPYT